MLLEPCRCTKAASFRCPRQRILCVPLLPLFFGVVSKVCIRVSGTALGPEVSHTTSTIYIACCSATHHNPSTVRLLIFVTLNVPHPMSQVGGRPHCRRRIEAFYLVPLNLVLEGRANWLFSRTDRTRGVVLQILAWPALARWESVNSDKLRFHTPKGAAHRTDCGIVKLPVPSPVHCGRQSPRVSGLYGMLIGGPEG